MVLQVLPEHPNFGTRLGRVLGEAIGDVGSAYARKHLFETELEKVKKASNEGNVGDILTTILSAQRYVPGSERAIAAILPPLVEMARGRNVFNAGNGMPQDDVGQPAGAANAQQRPNGAGQRPSAMQGPQASSAAPQSRVGPMQGSSLPQEQNIAPQNLGGSSVGPDKSGLLQVQGDENLGIEGALTPQQFKAKFQAEILSGGDGSKSLGELRGIQETIKNGIELSTAQRDWLMQARMAERTREQQFSTFAEPLIQDEFDNISPLEMNRFRQYAKKIDQEATDEGKFLTPSDLYEKSRRRLEDYLTYKGNIEGNPKTGKRGIAPRPTTLSPGFESQSLGQGKKELYKPIREAVRPLVMMGEGEEVRRILGQKGYNFEETEEILNPLRQDQFDLPRAPIAAVKAIAKLNTIYSPITKLTSLIAKNSDAYKEQTEKNVDSLTNYLRKSIDPNTSLVLLRKLANQKLYDSNEFVQALDRLKEDGYELSPQQTKELPLLDRPSITDLANIFG